MTNKQREDLNETIDDLIELLSPEDLMTVGVLLERYLAVPIENRTTEFKTATANAIKTIVQSTITRHFQVGNC